MIKTATSLRPGYALVLGECPGGGRSRDREGVLLHDYPLAGSSARRLLLTHDRTVGRVRSLERRRRGEPSWWCWYRPLLELYDLGNAVPRPGFSPAVAAMELEDTEKRFPGLTVVACGARLRTLLGWHPASDHAPWFEWQRWRSWDWVAVPHPSGLNRLWNDPATEHRTGLALVTAAERAAAVREDS